MSTAVCTPFNEGGGGHRPFHMQQLGRSSHLLVHSILEVPTMSVLACFLKARRTAQFRSKSSTEQPLCLVEAINAALSCPSRSCESPMASCRSRYPLSRPRPRRSGRFDGNTRRTRLGQSLVQELFRRQPTVEVPPADKNTILIIPQWHNDWGVDPIRFGLVSDDEPRKSPR
jgi:hypothetical protein